jgi:hypothetical protein
MREALWATGQRRKKEKTSFGPEESGELYEALE